MNRLLSLLGLCARAGRLISGEKAAVAAIRGGSARCALLDGGAAANTEKSVADACAYHGVPLIRMEPDCLGDAIGKPGRMAAAVTDPGFAEGLLRLAKQEKPEG